MGNAELPKGWTEARLDEVATLVFGQSPPSSTYNMEGTGLPFFQGKAEFGPLHPTASKWCTEPKRIAEAGDVLISVRAPVGPTNVAGTRCGIGRGLAAIRTHISKNYIRYWLLRSRDELASKGTGTTFSAITKDVLKSHQIPIAPLNEQHRIVEKIESLFARIDKGEEALREVQKLLKRYRQSILKAAVTGELTRDWREANQQKLEPASDLLAGIMKARADNWQGARKSGNSESPTVDKMPEIPSEWEWASLDSLCVEGPTNGISPKPGNTGTGIKSFKLTATTSGQFLINDETIKRVDLQLDHESKYWLRSGDILIQRGNTIDYVGTAAIFPGPDNQYIYPDLMIRIRIRDALLAQWAVAWINAYFAKQYLKRNATGTAGNMPKINGKTLKALAVPIPPIKEIQLLLEVLERHLSQVRQLEHRLEQERDRATSLRQSILKSAFTGQLVSQDPDDESASDLLARIRAEREAKPKNRSEKKFTKKARAKA